MDSTVEMPASAVMSDAPLDEEGGMPGLGGAPGMTKQLRVRSAARQGSRQTSDVKFHARLNRSAGTAPCASPGVAGMPWCICGDATIT